MKKPKKPSRKSPVSVWGLMRVHTEAGLDQICRDIERRARAGEKFFTAEDHRRLREEVFGEPDKGSTE
jgi:hypothetical protein